MCRLDEFVSKRHKIADRYNVALKDLPLKTPVQLEDTYSGLHLYVIRLDLSRINKTHKQVFNELREQGLGVNLHYIPIHTHPYYQQLGFKQGDFPIAEQYYKEAISLPMFPDLTDDQFDSAIAILTNVLQVS